MHKLPVWRTVADGYRFTFKNIGLLLKVSLVWLVVSYAAGFVFGVAVGLIDAPGPLTMLLLMRVAPALVGILAASAVAVGWHRAILLEERATGPFSVSLRKRVWKFFFVSILFAGLGYLLFVLATLVLLKLGGSNWLTLALMIAILVLLCLLFVRLNLLFPAIAIESATVNLERSWHLTKGNAWRLILGNIACFLPVSIIAGLFIDWSGAQTGAGNLAAASVISIVGQALTFLAVALLAAFLSFAYKELVPEVRDSDFQEA